MTDKIKLKADNDARKFAMAMSEKVEKQLREEIAELKKENLVLHEMNVKRIEYYNQLTKAKEIIKQLLLLPYANNEEVYSDVTSFLYEAEQFLNGE